MWWQELLKNILTGGVSTAILAVGAITTWKLGKRKAITDEQNASVAAEKARADAEDADEDRRSNDLAQAARIALEAVQPFRDSNQRLTEDFERFRKQAELDAERHQQNMNQMREEQRERDEVHKGQMDRLQETNNKIVRSLQVLLRDLLLVVRWYERGQPEPTPEEKDLAITRAETAIKDLDEEQSDVPH